MPEIALTQGKVCIVDQEDLEVLSQFKWCANQKGSSGKYYATNKKLGDMHRFLMGSSGGLQVDHINGDSLDNRRSNLRFATASQQNVNKGKVTRKTTSRFKGVLFHKRLKKWQAYYYKNRRQIYLGVFENEEDAARAYDSAVIAAFGEYARPNFKEST